MPEKLSHTIVNVAARLRTMARLQPYKRAVVCPCGRDSQGRVAYTHLTFRQLDIESDCLAQGLDDMGISRGVRTILMVKPSLDFFALVFALFKVGAVPVVVDPGMGVSRMLNCLKESQAQALIGIPPAHVLRTLAPGYFKSVKTFITVGSRWFWGGLTLGQVRNRLWQPYRMADTRADEIAAILFTTGSTGPAKGVFYTHGVFDAQVRSIRTQFGITPDEIDLPTFPLFALFDPALGMTAIIPDMDPTKPAHVNPERIIEAIVNQGVTTMFASPALLDRVGRYGKEKGIKLPTLKRVISAGAPAAPANIEQFSAMLTEGAQVHTGYGATEAMPVSAFGSDEILGETRKLSEQGYGMCVGKPIAGIDVRIIRISDGLIAQWTDDLVLPNGEIGEISVRGDQVTRGYYERPRDDALAKIIDGDAFWHRMGDLGWIDKKGRIWFCGRKSHRVSCSKKTMFTIPCEAIFNNHPRVFRSALVGVGPQGRQRPVACIELVPGDSGKGKKGLKKELLALAKANPLSEDIETILFHRGFPVDIRHNSKIFREQLAVWAEKKG
ncbi:fatty acid CoA ligase family protein [Desulfosarcina sp.]|uniref:fatty acid CoA ligase family protein n=1 Tax=Desulfosarcina sp. TaxID=2027861 RepID=UPI0029A8FA45|nr:fatty acid CoA ligase family protein [Desulfosarcina sp.]MDX2453960.1 fatty acid CoA ligase family protein [Desulfosarcina sp.]MDX2491654.1 fatty acid CoA ligase family protein [Desulfosarcina sp.]